MHEFVEEQSSLVSTKVRQRGIQCIVESHITQAQYIAVTFHIIVLGLFRSSILFLYRRIFVGRIFVVVFYGLLTWTVAWTLSFVIAYIVGSLPETYECYSKHPGFPCLVISTITDCLTVTSAFSDFMLLVTPLPFLWNLKMPQTRKLGAMAVFILGNLFVI